MAKSKMAERIEKIITDRKRIRNICIAAHIDHGKTTFSDNLLAGAGMISEELAGEQCYMDFDSQEQERGITIYSANVSMVHEYKGEEYLINLIDTPGHVDFGGDVTRAMRAVDGAIVLVCAVDGVMPQTETVLKQALRERVKPVLFINKVDRLIKELKLTPEQMQERFMKIIEEVNQIIDQNAPEEFRKEWKVSVNDGKVAFGSAFKNWGISVPYMKESGITFKDIIEMTEQGREKELAKKAPLHIVALDMVVRHLPTPIEAQKYRIERLWTGDLNTPEGKAMIECDPNGPVIGVVTNVAMDKHAGSVCTVRLFSGTLKDGDTVFEVRAQKEERVQQVGVYEGPRRLHIGKVTAGNIIAVTGLTNVTSGETICDPNHKIPPFEAIKHVFEPVVTKSIEVKNVKDLPKVIEILRQRAREDPTIVVKISEDTGEMLVSGLGELHIEAKIERFLRDRNLDIVVSPPIVIYKETVTKKSDVAEGKSPNKHNRFYFTVEPLSKEIVEKISSEEFEALNLKKVDPVVIAEELGSVGFPREDAKRIVHVYNGNMLVDMTRGIQYLHEVIELVKQGFIDVMDRGPLAEEPCTGVRVNLVDAKLHEDAIHRGPAQVIPAVRSAIKVAMLMGDAVIAEPKQIIRIDTPTEYMGKVMTEIQNRRGQVLEMNEERGNTVIKAKVPVPEMFGFEAALKGATGGRGFQSLIDIVYEVLPRNLQEQVILQIRNRKGLKPKVPEVSDYSTA